MTENQEYLVYPIIFCYRHAAELYLKQLVVVVGQLLNRELPVPVTHDLLPLWTLVNASILEVWTPGSGNVPHAGLAGIEQWLQELSKMDEGSFTFRYPYTAEKKNRPARVSIDRGLRHIDMSSFAKRMGRLLNIFDSWDTGLSTMLDQQLEHEQFFDDGQGGSEDVDAYRYEMEADYRREMEGEYPPA